MKNSLSTLLFLFLSFTQLSANEFRAGVISLQQLSASSVQANISLVIDVHSDIADLSLCWGDGQCDQFPALSVQANAALGIKSYEFSVLHSYSNQQSYTVSIEKCCFDNDISNMTSPANHNFVIETSLDISAGLNSTPHYPGIQVGSNFSFQIVGIEGWVDDPEGDEYVSELCAIDVPGYMQPGEITPLPGNDFIYSAGIGDIIWNTPPVEGIYLVQTCTSEQRNGVEISNSKRIACLLVGDFSSAVNELKNGDWAIYPNPIQDKKINLRYSGSQQSASLQVQVFNAQQGLVYSEDFEDTVKQRTIDLSAAAAGLYFVLLRTEAGVYYEEVLLVE